jgi:hypothetical protein
MRRLVIAFVVVTVSFSLVGCGGADTSTPPAPTSQDPVEEAPPLNYTEGDVDGDRTPVEGGYPMAFPTKAEAIPEQVQQRLDDGQAMLIFYYDEGRGDTDEVETEIDAVIEEYRGLIDLIEFEISEGIPAEADEEDEEARKKGYLLAIELSVKETPYIIIVDQGGTVTWRARGYVDRGLIEREVRRATE